MHELNATPLDKLEAAMVGNFPVLKMQVEHIFTPGIYTRILHIPKHAMLSGKIHLTDHPFMIVKGMIKIVTPHGPITLKAGHYDVTVAGSQRVGFAMEDTTWITVHANPDDCRDLAEIERRIIQPRVNPLLHTKTLSE